MRAGSLLLMVLTASLSAVSNQTPSLQVEAARLQQVIREHPADALAHYQLGIVDREMGDNRSAVTNLQAAIRGGFDNLGAKLNLVEASFLCRQTVLAVVTSREILAANVKSVDVLLRVGRLLFDHLFYKDAQQAFSLARLAAPDDYEPRFRLALTYYMLDDYAGTLTTLKDSHGDRINAEAVSLKASAEAELGNVGAAWASLRSEIEQDPDSPHAYINLALIALDRGRLQEAEDTLERFRTLNSQSSAKVFFRAEVNVCPKIVAALQNSASWTDSSRKQGEFYYQLAMQLEAGFNFLSSVELTALAQANDGNSAQILLLAGKSCLNQDSSSPEAASILRAAVAKDPKLYQGFYLLGRWYAHRGEVEEAIAAYQAAISLHPDADYYVDLGKVLQNRQSAVANFLQALALNPTNAEAHFQLGRAYGEGGQLEKARSELEAAIELEPDFYEADFLLGRLLHRIGDEKQSETMLHLFTEKKSILMQQSVIGAGYSGNIQ